MTSSSVLARLTLLRYHSMRHDDTAVFGSAFGYRGRGDGKSALSAVRVGILRKYAHGRRGAAVVRAVPYTRVLSGRQWWSGRVTTNE